MGSVYHPKILSDSITATTTTIPITMIIVLSSWQVIARVHLVQIMNTAQRQLILLHSPKADTRDGKNLGFWKKFKVLVYKDVRSKITNQEEHPILPILPVTFLSINNYRTNND